MLEIFIGLLSGYAFFGIYEAGKLVYKWIRRHFCRQPPAQNAAAPNLAPNQAIIHWEDDPEWFQPAPAA